MQSVCRECSEVVVLQNFNEIVIPKGMKRRNQTTPGIGKSIKSRLNVVFITMLESESAIYLIFQSNCKDFSFPGLYSNIIHSSGLYRNKLGTFVESYSW